MLKEEVHYSWLSVKVKNKKPKNSPCLRDLISEKTFDILGQARFSA